MSYNGSGTFQINTSGQPVVTGTVISSSAFNALTADLATGLSTAITKDGQTATTVRIPFAQGINSSLATDSTSGSTGSIFTAGGVGIAKALYVGTNVTVVGTLGVTGAATFSATPIFSALTASSAVATDASKNLVSVTNTGTGSNVLATSPTITTPTISSLTSAAATALTLQSAGTTAVTIDTSQNVGIGTTSPAGKLDINTGVSTGTTDMITLGGLDNASTKQTYAVIQMGIENNTASSEQGNILLQTVESGTVRTRINLNGSGYQAFSNGGTERMRINSSGNLLVGTTSISAGRVNVLAAAGATGILVQVTNNGDYGLAFNNASGTNVGRIQIDSAATSYVTSSDYRLKNSIAPMTGALAKVALLKPCTYKWNEDNSDAEGFIAHELAEVCPQAVSGAKDAVDADGNIISQGIDTSFLVATLTAAIQEQQALIISLTARIAALEAK
jgi:hypothetical protein